MVEKMIEEILSNAHCRYGASCLSCNEDRCKKCSDYAVDYEDIIQIAEKHKGQEQRWISVDERLPEEATQVLVWLEYFRYGDYNEYQKTCGIGMYMFDRWHVYDFGECNVIAWMPLPKYEEGDAR